MLNGGVNRDGDQNNISGESSGGGTDYIEEVIKMIKDFKKWEKPQKK